MVDVSIIIINYNSNELLKDCLDSFYKTADGYTFEMIVVDNSDERYNAKPIVEQYPCTKFIKNEVNLGFSLANNKGIEAAEGKYILILNNDVIFTENTLKVLKDYCDSLNGEVIIGCKLLNADGSHQDSLVEFDNPWNTFTENFFLYKLFPRSKYFNKYYQNYIETTEPFEVDMVKGAFMFCTADLIRKIKGFDKNFYFYYEETDLCYRFKKMGGRVIYFPGTSIIHLGGATTDSMPWFKFKNQTVSKIKFYQKNYKGAAFFLPALFHYTGVLIRVPVYFLMGVLKGKKSLFYKSFYYFKQLFIYPKYLPDINQ